MDQGSLPGAIGSAALAAVERRKADGHAKVVSKKQHGYLYQARDFLPRHWTGKRACERATTAEFDPPRRSQVVLLWIHRLPALPMHRQECWELCCTWLRRACKSLSANCPPCCNSR